MKKLLLIKIFGLILLFASCTGGITNNGDDNTGDNTGSGNNYQAGEIPGLGDADGELTGTPFVLPDGVTLLGDITASGNSYGYWNLSKAQEYHITNKDGSVTTAQILPKSNRSDSLVCYFGSGSGLVDLLIPLHNSNDFPVKVTFPAALIVRNIAGICQNGVLLKKAIVEIPAKTDCYLNLSFYCANLSKDTPGGSDTYQFSVVSDAKPILELCDKLKNKKINIEEFDPTNADDMSTFESQAATLQIIVWMVTDYDGVGVLYSSYLNNLPNSD